MAKSPTPYSPSLSAFNLKKEIDVNQLAILTHYLQEDNASNLLTQESFHIITDKFGYPATTSTLLREEGYFDLLFNEIKQVPFPPIENPKFTFIDLFAGMGGFRLAMQSQGGKCVFSSEWNKFSQQTYYANFGEMPFGDITKESTKKFIPNNFDVLCAGFPCQPFSIAGVSKKNSLGRAHGFFDQTQGTLFFDVAEIIQQKTPKAFILENVKNLVSHDKGNTFKVIYNTLKELGYTIFYKVLNGKYYVPQNRERIFIVGFRTDLFGINPDFHFPTNPEKELCLKDILDENTDAKYTLTDKLWQYLQNYAAKHKAAGNGFGFGLVDINGITRTLSARYYKDGSEILIPQTDFEGNAINPRRLTPKECTRLMGYPEEYNIHAVSDLQGYKQCGNSVVVPLVESISKQVITTLLSQGYE